MGRYSNVNYYNRGHTSSLLSLSTQIHGYDAHGNLSELSFRIKTQFGEMAFRLPANIEAVEAILTRQFRSGRSRFTSREYATKVAWRILKDCGPISRARQPLFPVLRSKKWVIGPPRSTLIVQVILP
jgi:hypothetical protein